MEVRRIPMEQLGPLLEEQLAHGFARLPVTGSSMLPMLREGRDMVRLVRADGPLDRGEVLLYRRESGQYVLHRLIRMEDEKTCLCCGDNQWEKELVPLERVIARAESFSRRGSWVDTRHNPIYCCYRTIWTALFPVRRPIILVRRLLGCLRRSIKYSRREAK